jgi:hypothetical protein
LSRFALKILKNRLRAIFYVANGATFMPALARWFLTSRDEDDNKLRRTLSFRRAARPTTV